MNKSHLINYTIDNDLPIGWSFSTIDDIGKIIRGISFPKDSKVTSFRKGYIACLRTTNVQKDVLLDDLWFVPESFLRREEQIAKNDDILISAANSLQLVGKVAQIKSISLKATIGAFISIIRVLEPTNPRFIYYQLSSPEIQAYFKKIASTTTNISNLSNTDILSTKLKIPPLNEQKRIVFKLEELFTKLDAGIEYLKKNQILLKRYRQSILKHAFEGNLTEKWREENRKKIEHASLIIDNIYQLKDGSKKKQNLKLIKDNLIKIPKDWIWTTVGDIAQSMKNGIYKPPQFYNEKGIACLRMYNIEEGNLIWKDIKRMDLTKDEIKEYQLNPGDILVNRVNSRELVGKAATIPHGLEPCVYESKNIRLRVFDKFINSKLVSFWFLLSGQRYFNRNAQQTVGMASINQVQLGAMPIPLMSIEEQELLTREIERRFSIIFHNLKNIETYLGLCKNLHQSILQIAFSGRLVPQDSNDEPASVLLEKIKKEQESAIPIKKEKSKITKKKSIDNDSKQMRLM